MRLGIRRVANISLCLYGRPLAEVWMGVIKRVLICVLICDTTYVENRHEFVREAIDFGLFVFPCDITGGDNILRLRNERWND